VAEVAAVTQHPHAAGQGCYQRRGHHALLVERGRSPYLVTRWTPGMKNADKFEKAFLSLLGYLDWQVIANESASAETIAAEKELDVVLAEIARATKLG
jgi:hypothetical protein